MAQTRHALLVGINDYDAAHATRCPEVPPGKPPCRCDWQDLEGSVNDVRAMREILIAKYGFEPQEIKVLTDREATREEILAAIRSKLIVPARPGDEVLFFYAGHGSQIKNSLSDEPDQLDETIVPADARHGAPDIRDKRRLFDEILDRKARLTADEVLVVGNPTIAAELKLAPYNLPSLPESGKEAAAIAASFGAQPLVGDTAGKAAILQRLPQRRLLHLATHGLLEGFGDPLIPGALVFVPGKEDDGLLTAKEILSMNLHAELAVLSACDTGGGRITSDGVIGLSRAFLSAGVPNVVVSLWSIPDAPTSGLMQRFYRELKDNPDPGRALRQACWR